MTGTDKRIKEKNKALQAVNNLGVWLVVLGMFILLSIVSDKFLQKDNLINLIRQIAVTGITALGATFIILSGEIDHHCAQPMRAEIDAKIDDLQPSVLVLDFAGVTFMDSSGIGLIMGRHRTMEAIGGSVIVRDPPPHIRRVIRLSGMERIAQIQIQKPSCREGDFGIGGGENA